ncbi:MAG: hypothetical protein N4A37_05970 [Prolixibacteraceae bacterium]|nr:hypothetical protein [Prolixibacteraceae bacterium]
MVPPWFVHGLSIDFALFDGGTMDEPWTNHEESPFNSIFYLVGFYAKNEVFC